MENKYGKVGVAVLVGLGLAVIAFSSGSTEAVHVDCPDNATTVSYQEAINIVSESDGFFDEGCIQYHVDNKPEFAVVERGQ